MPENEPPCPHCGGVMEFKANPDNYARWTCKTIRVGGKIVRSLDCLEKEVASLHLRLEQQQDRDCYVGDKAIQDFCSGEHKVYGEDSSAPICQFRRWFEAGDRSVGLAASAGWELTENQEGTILQEIREQRSDLLEALKACDDAFAGWQAGTVPGRPEDILALIVKTRAAIAKAEGRAKV